MKFSQQRSFALQFADPVTKRRGWKALKILPLLRQPDA
jgi:hypothetical protein